MPQGVIFVGPPGTGKTFFVKALGKEIGFNAVALNMQNILGGIVGTSERNLARALSVVKSLSPVLVFMDELDQSDVSARGNNSGNPVAKNLFSQLCSSLATRTTAASVVFFGASNRPDLMDDALLRFGRIDAIIPVLLPEEPEREAIAQATARSLGVNLVPNAAYQIASNSDKYSAADVAQVVIKARKIAARDGRDLDRRTRRRLRSPGAPPGHAGQGRLLHHAGRPGLQRHRTAAAQVRRPAGRPQQARQDDPGRGRHDVGCRKRSDPQPQGVVA